MTMARHRHRAKQFKFERDEARAEVEALQKQVAKLTKALKKEQEKQEAAA